MEFVKSNKGADFLVVDGYTFRKEKVIQEKEIWRCTEYRKAKCRSRCHTIGSNFEKLPTEHNHVPDTAAVEARKAVTCVKERAASTTEATHQIVSSSSANVTAAVATQLPSVANLKQTIRRIRRQEHAPLPTPVSFNDLQLPEEFTVTDRGERFLIHDSGPGTQRFLIFATTRNMELLARSQNWYSDGTFKTAPPLFQQVYTIHVRQHGTVIPAVYVLMNERSTNAYVRVLTELKNIRPDLNPSTVMTDFEQAALLAFRKIFPNVEQQGCLFHLSQCIWRRLSQTGDLQTRDTSDSQFALEIRQLAALAFVPVDQVVAAFEALQDSQFYIDNEAEIRDLLSYFEDNWIGRPNRRGQRLDAIFPLSLWNVYNAALQDLPKTNNAVEGWHRGFSEILGSYHPSIWKFIEALKKEQSLNELKLEQYVAGENPPRGRKIYRDSAQRLKAIVEDFHNRPILDYVRGVAHNLNLQV